MAQNTSTTSSQWTTTQPGSLSITKDTSTVVTNADGFIVSSTTTQTIATFSTKDSDRGTFLGATSQTDGGDKTKISYGDAAKAIGYTALANTTSKAATVTWLGGARMATAQDAGAHLYKYAFAAAEVGMLFTPLPEAYAAYEGVKAFEEAGFAAWHLAWELDTK